MNTNQNIVLITGASSGVGKATAEHLADQGLTVFASAPRSEAEKLTAMQRDNLIPLHIDVTDDEEIRAAVEQIQASHGRIDVLVNNAGFGLYGSIEGLSMQQVQKVFNVNLFGTGRMVQAVLPLMRAQKSGKIINVSSIVGKVSTPMLGWYAATKHGIEAMSDALRLEVKPLGISVILMEPGTTRTGFEDVSMDILEQSNDPADYDDLKERFRIINREGFKKAPGPQPIAEAIHEAIGSSNPRIRYRIGKEAKMFIPVKRLMSDRLMDRLILSQY